MASYDHLLREKRIEDATVVAYNAVTTWQEQLGVLKDHVRQKKEQGCQRCTITNIARGAGVKRQVVEYLLGDTKNAVGVKLETYIKILAHLGFELKIVELKEKVAERN